MAVTQSMIDGLNQMIADGVRQATIDGQTVTYNTADSRASFSVPATIAVAL